MKLKHLHIRISAYLHINKTSAHLKFAHLHIIKIPTFVPNF